MLYAWIGDEKRPPKTKGERAVCRDCGGQLIAVMPVENVPHWRHKGGDCDPWSEPEGPWHLGWKEEFELACREVVRVDESTGEHHRADVLYGADTLQATVLEFQHSPIAEEERNARETFYRRAHRMFWLVHIHNEQSFLAHHFGFSIDFQKRPVDLDGKKFAIMDWMGPSKQFIEKWKRATAHVFFDWGGQIYYLAGEKAALRLGGPFKRGQFALCRLTREEFVLAVRGEDSRAA